MEFSPYEQFYLGRVMMKAIKILLFFLVALAGLFFLYGVYLAIRYSNAGTPSQMPEFVTTTTTAIGAVLATNLGAVLGLKIAEGSRFRSFRIRALADPIPSAIQIGATVFYLLVLLVAFIAWALMKFESDPTLIVLVIPRLSQTLAGVIVGAVAVILNVTHKP
jgi:hypothetical protein